jgi:hypothetical protein
MRFLMMIKATAKSESGALPSEAGLSAMMKYNEELSKAGVLLDLAGLHPSSKGARIQFKRGVPTVIDGPFTETKELVAGYWLIQVASRAEAIEWARRVPWEGPSGAMEGDDGEIELRQLFDMADFPEANAETLATAAKIGATLQHP